MKKTLGHSPIQSDEFPSHVCFAYRALSFAHHGTKQNLICFFPPRNMARSLCPLATIQCDVCLTVTSSEHSSHIAKAIDDGAQFVGEPCREEPGDDECCETMFSIFLASTKCCGSWPIPPGPAGSSVGWLQVGHTRTFSLSPYITLALTLSLHCKKKDRKVEWKCTRWSFFSIHPLSWFHTIIFTFEGCAW